ncbi:MAG: hypothetical protein ACYS0E_17840 [Planctomycetota bacterium]|jgi:hypothetical protein
MCEDLTRRKFLRGSGLAMMSLPFLNHEALAAKRKYKTKHLIMIAFAGGVRSKETIHTPANVPNLMRIAEQGVIAPNVNVMNNGHFGATMTIFTGNTEYRGIRENDRGPNPTVFEYVRKGNSLPAQTVWLSTSGGAQQRNLVYSQHEDYGQNYGANLIDAEGVFNTEFRRVIDSFGKPSVPGKAEEDAVAKLRKAMNPPPAAKSGLANDPETIDRLQKYILEEIAGKTARITGPGSSDARALQVAVSVLRIFRPTMLGIVLQNADIAHGSFNAYQNVIQRADEQIGRLWDSIQADPQLRDSTSIMVLPEFGRDSSLNQRNGLDHGDNTPDLRKVAMVAAGPDFKSGKTISKDFKSIDVTPTACALMGVKSEHAKGRLMRELLVR